MSYRVLITGCCGFIGSHLCDFFLKKELEVIGIDNLMTGRIENISNFISNQKFDFIEHDICKPIKIKSNINFILHFASPASPFDYLKFPIETLEIGSKGTENALKLALEKNSIILVASTSEVYGDPLEHPQKETYYGNVNPIGPRGVYDEAKRYLEAITMAYHKKYNLNTKIVRIFNTYGENMRLNDGRAIPNFINQALNNLDFTVFGDGSQTRSFTYIDDTIMGIYKLLMSTYNYPVNIGNPHEYTVNELIHEIKKIIPTTSKLSYHKLPENDPLVRKPDITLAKKILKWEPKIKLEIGLLKTINYFKNLK